MATQTKSFYKELTKDKWIRSTSRGGNEIYIINHHNAPRTMEEIGRLREISFSAAGGGTGKKLDIDEYDTAKDCYDQLIVYNPQTREIIGGYRFIHCSKILPKIHQLPPPLSTQHYFEFSQQFIEKYLPTTIELGRSWIRPEYQLSKNYKRGLYALDNLWEGLGSLLKIYPKTEYFFGKVTLYPQYHPEARDILLSFLHHFFPDREALVQPIVPQPYRDYTHYFIHLNYKEAFRKLNKLIRSKGEIIPPLFNIYMNLSPTMKMFGTAKNPDFGDVEESAILIRIADIHPEIKARYSEADT